MKASLDLLRALGVGDDLTYEGSTTSAVTTSRGVRWNEDAISRDLLQNFYDANIDSPARGRPR